MPKLTRKADAGLCGVRLAANPASSAFRPFDAPAPATSMVDRMLGAALVAVSTYEEVEADSEPLFIQHSDEIFTTPGVLPKRKSTSFVTREPSSKDPLNGIVHGGE